MRIVLVFLLLLMMSARSVRGETIVLRGAAQGTTYHIKFVKPAKEFATQRLQADVEQFLADIDRQMSTYRADSEISRFNRAPAGVWFSVSPAVVEVVKAAQEISELSDGAMDITVGPLVQLWHFGPRANKPPSPRPLPEGEGVAKQKFAPPPEEQLRNARMRVGYKKLEFRQTPPALRKEVDGLEVDLSSIASGYTIDHLSALMVEHGVKDFMVELGGEVRAGGKREDGTPWRIAIERPTAEKREMEVAVPLVNACARDGRRHAQVFRVRRSSLLAHHRSIDRTAGGACAGIGHGGGRYVP